MEEKIFSKPYKSLCEAALCHAVFFGEMRGRVDESFLKSVEIKNN